MLGKFLLNSFRIGLKKKLRLKGEPLSFLEKAHDFKTGRLQIIKKFLNSISQNDEFGFKSNKASLIKSVENEKRFLEIFFNKMYELIEDKKSDEGKLLKEILNSDTSNVKYERYEKLFSNNIKEFNLMLKSYDELILNLNKLEFNEESKKNVILFFRNLNSEISKFIKDSGFTKKNYDFYFSNIDDSVRRYSKNPLNFPHRTFRGPLIFVSFGLFLDQLMKMDFPGADNPNYIFIYALVAYVVTMILSKPERIKFANFKNLLDDINRSSQSKYYI